MRADERGAAAPLPAVDGDAVGLTPGVAAHAIAAASSAASSSLHDGVATLSADDGRYRHDGLFWRRLAYAGATRGPEWWRRSTPPLFAAILFALIGDNRRGVIRNLQRIRGPQGPLADHRDALRTFVEFAYCLTETLEQASPRPRPMQVDAPAEIERTDLLPEGRGVVVLTSHFGSWEIAAHLMRRFGRRVNVVMAREANPSVEAFQTELRARSGLRVLHSDSSPFASVEMLHALRRGEVVAIQMDRAAPGQVTRPIEFFGAPAPFQYGPFALARVAGVPLWPVFAARLGVRRYRIMPEPLRTIARDASEEETLAVMRDVVRSFERHVRAHPHQWFQFKPFWDTPEGR
jgi:lauroyl/myristoyl acyltransferase